LSEGFHKRGVALTRIAELVAAAPAINFGLYPRKGTLAVGGDADLAIVDLDRRETVSPAVLLSAQDFTPFEGMELTGWPVLTVLRGQVVYSEGRIMVQPGIGRYLRRPVLLHGNTDH
jgi:dihydroorotase-like cyclic amidohydrolase